MSGGNDMGRKQMGRRMQLPAIGSVVVLGIVPVLALASPERASAQAAPQRAQSAGLEGSWRGGGSVAFGGGQQERAQCRAQFRRSSASSYTVTAICATASGRATQTATVRRVGGNSYRGTFHNSEYNTSGTIFITVAGNRQSVRLTGDAGSASLELRR
jgi:hypothetical protein